jgi:hypothetical protein
MPVYDKKHLELMDRVEAMGAGLSATVPEGCGFFLCVWEREDGGNSVALGDTEPEEARAAIERWFAHRQKRDKA